jgi:hypothetical protein
MFDIRGISYSMPGAELLEVINVRASKGKVSVLIGPVGLSFVGTARFEEIDAETYRARLKGQGSDSKGRCGAGMIQDVATEIISQFAASMSAMLQHENAVAVAASNPAAGASALTLPPPVAPISGFPLMSRILWNSIRRFFGRS